MATEKIERELRTRLRELLGDVATMALFEKFPPNGWSARFDAIDTRFDAMQDDIDQRFEVVDRRFDAMRADMDRRFDAVDRRFDAVDRRFDAIDAQFDRHEDRFDALAHQLTATFRGELNGAITAQTKSIILGILGAMVAVGGLTLAAAGMAG